MNETIHLKNLSFPKMIGNLNHSNQLLKLLTLTSLAVASLSLLGLYAALTRPTPIITLNATGNVVEQVTIVPKAEDLIDVAIRRYVDLRYHWDPKTVQQKMKAAEKFILPATLKVFNAQTAPTVKFSTEKLVSQSVFPEHTLVDLTAKSVFITGTRITDIQGLKAAGNLKLTLFFESGPRTPENPWGVYIVKEKEE